MGDAPKEFLSQFGHAVRAARQTLGISQEELAARSQLHRTYLAGIERGIRNPSLKSIARIAKGLGLSASALFQRMEAMARGVEMFVEAGSPENLTRRHLKRRSDVKRTTRRMNG